MTLTDDYPTHSGSFTVTGTVGKRPAELKPQDLTVITGETPEFKIISANTGAYEGITAYDTFTADIQVLKDGKPVQDFSAPGTYTIGIDPATLKVSNENGLDPAQVMASYDLSFASGTLTVLDEPPALSRVSVDYRNETLSPADPSDVLYYSWDAGTDWSEWKKLESGMDLSESLDAAGNGSLTLYFRTGISAVAELVIPPRPKTPQTPSAAQITANSIRVAGADGCEYSIDGNVWQDSPVFEGLEPDTAYTIWQRVKATDSSFASLAVKASFTTASAPEGDRPDTTPAPEEDRPEATPAPTNAPENGAQGEETGGPVRTADESPAEENLLLMLAAAAVALFAAARVHKKKIR